MASSQVNPKNKKDTLRDMFDDSHADTNADAGEGEELDEKMLKRQKWRLMQKKIQLMSQTTFLNFKDK